MSFHDLKIPASEATVSVKAYDTMEDVRKVSVPAASFLSPALPGHEVLRLPAFAFLVENSTLGRRVMFDLGARKDAENGAPSIAEAIKAGYLSMPVGRDIVEQLGDDGVDLNSINAVIWSHAHFDHIGDTSKFPASTELVFGGATSTATHETNPTSHLKESDFAGRKSVPLDFEESTLVIGGLRAVDFFRDGSFYLLDAPGHLAGHICALARVTPTSFVYLGGDACHHPGMLRPSANLHRHFPCPGALLAATRTSVSAAHFAPPGAGEFDLAARTTPLLDVAEGGFYAEPPAARASIAKMGDFDANEDVFVVLAHDATLEDVVGPFPTVLNEWKAKGWKERVIWSFLEEGNASFRFNEKTA
ncbi:beta-lactamase-like protein [Mycena metata]|uniref:Beta-lactamase-like protein n=1 Tax=Mycena metata TaxID=1033252 RepID=A0AAD7KG88_9AGAR|nr:beta-lactamase-like protein [Mycena metata]